MEVSVNPFRLIQVRQVIKRKPHSLLPNSNLPTIETEPQIEGRSVAQAVIAALSPQRPRFDSKSPHMRFVVDNVAVGQVFFSDYLYLTLIL